MQSLQPFNSAITNPDRDDRSIRAIINYYLTFDRLNERLIELPKQFQEPTVRRWQPIAWREIQPEQVVGMSVETMTQILRGAIDTEAPIRDYTQTSRQYLEPIHPDLARFVGGTVNPAGELMEIGLWEKEERRHTPILCRVYAQLTGEAIEASDRDVRPYQPMADASADLYRHGLHRVATEYGATCLYLWLMAHSRGALRQVFTELMLDEMNHMTKYWGFGVWAYPESSWWNLLRMLLKTSKLKLQYNRSRGSLIGTLSRMTDVLAWSAWSWGNRLSFIWTCSCVLWRMLAWQRSLNRSFLDGLFDA